MAKKRKPGPQCGGCGATAEKGDDGKMEMEHRWGCPWMKRTEAGTPARAEAAFPDVEHSQILMFL